MVTKLGNPWNRGKKRGIIQPESRPVSLGLMSKWLQSYAYHTNIPLWIFAFTGALIYIIARVTISYQSYRSASANPVDILGDE